MFGWSDNNSNDDSFWSFGSDNGYDFWSQKEEKEVQDLWGLAQQERKSFWQLLWELFH